MKLGPSRILAVHMHFFTAQTAFECNTATSLLQATNAFSVEQEQLST